jgi:hypothetical protein
LDPYGLKLFFYNNFLPNSASLKWQPVPHILGFFLSSFFFFFFIVSLIRNVSSNLCANHNDIMNVLILLLVPPILFSLSTTEKSKKSTWIRCLWMQLKNYSKCSFKAHLQVLFQKPILKKASAFLKTQLYFFVNKRTSSIWNQTYV